jgi:hypothetical protein
VCMQMLRLPVPYSTFLTPFFHYASKIRYASFEELSIQLAFCYSNAGKAPAFLVLLVTL